MDIINEALRQNPSQSDDLNQVKSWLESTLPSNESNEKGATKMSKAEELANLLEHTHNLILHGAPGTGKTHLAKDIASFMHYQKNYEDLTDEEKEHIKEYIGFVQFHPSYDYTDFVEGLRPVNDCTGGQIGFERKDGVFKKFCERALHDFFISESSAEDLLDKFKKELQTTKEIEVKSIRSPLIFSTYISQGKISVKSSSGNQYSVSDFDIKHYLETQQYDKSHDTYAPGIGQYILDNYSNGVINSKSENKKPFVFIIDEINRGEMSKIFGELFFSIDPGYRGKAGLIQTQYQNLISENNIFYNGFYVPENVYIIGTMNDIDRNVESMDFAFRRRFTFKEIKSTDTQQDILAGLDDSIRDDAIRRMNSLNDEISNIEGLSSAYHIGGAYFLKLKELDNDFEKLWEYHLEGLLREYLRGMEDIDSKVEQLKDAYDCQKNEENF